MIADKIKMLREGLGITQAELARRLGVTRSGVNAWEMGLSAPTTQYIVALSRLFHVSTDYILETESALTVSMNGYTPEETALIFDLLKYFDSRKG